MQMEHSKSHSYFKRNWNTKATDKIQIDRYSQISDKGVSISFLDSLNTFNGWKTTFNKSGSWIQYNSVDFGQKKIKSVVVKGFSEKGGVLQMRNKGINKTIIAEVIIPKGSTWAEIKSPLLKIGIGNSKFICYIER